MDLVFSTLPDAYCYQALRHQTYDNPWVQQEYTSTRSERPCHTVKTGSKSSCPICEEQKRRPLSNYIRSKSKQDRTEVSNILEENEDEDVKVDVKNEKHLASS